MSVNVYPTVENLCNPVKGRPKSSSADCAKKIYHCPIEKCKYHETGRYFDKMKFLRQHFVKVHKIKSFSCDKCEKQFPSESFLKDHSLKCGISFQCYCKAEYNAYEALITHVKRKHNEDINLKYRAMMQLLKVHSAARNFQKSFDNEITVKAIIVENLIKQKLLRLRKKKTKSASSKETQTGMKMCKILPNVSTQTLTNKEQNTKTVSLQTTLEGLCRKRRKSKTGGPVCKVSCPRKNVSFSTSSTQTNPIKEDYPTLFTRNCSLSEVHDKTTGIEPDVFLNQSLSQSSVSVTLPVFEDNLNSNSSNFSENIKVSNDFNFNGYFKSTSQNTVCKPEMQTESIESFVNNLIGRDTDFIMCSDCETQTAFADYFDDSYMDTYTQTCESLFCDLDFVDIQTQTSWSIFDDTTVNNPTDHISYDC